jgi:hypothetical protein
MRAVHAEAHAAPNATRREEILMGRGLQDIEVCVIYARSAYSAACPEY